MALAAARPPRLHRAHDHDRELRKDVINDLARLPILEATLLAKRAKQPVVGRFVRNHPDFPLRGFVRCEPCGRPLTGGWSKGRNDRYAYYHCQRQCRAVNVSKKKLETISKHLILCSVCGAVRLRSE